MKYLERIIIILIILLVVGFSLQKYFSKKENNKPTPDNRTTIKSEEDKIEKIINNMTLEEKIGQMMIVAYRKPEINDEFKKILEEVKPGGFIVFKENITDYENTVNFLNEIKSTSKIPMFISTDQEGGRIQRLENIPGITLNNIPAMEEIGSTNDEKLAYETGKLIASDLKKFGINMDFAPVLDVYSNPNNKVIGDRSFGSDPYLVSKMGLSLAKGLQDSSIIPVYKHFPGHGNTETDSHKDLPIINKTKEELLNLDIIPFNNAIKNGAEVIMIGHLSIPNITNDNTPASLSKELINNYLRKELNYQNIVITDALNMKAITKNYTNNEIYELAINAGVDILLMPEDPIEAVNIIKELINNKSISESQINNSVKKIINIKNKYNILENI